MRTNAARAARCARHARSDGRLCHPRSWRALACSALASDPGVAPADHRVRSAARPLLPLFFFTDAGRRRAARVIKWFAEGTIWRHLWITLTEGDAGLIIGSIARRADRLLVCAPAAHRRGVRPLREDDQRAAAHRAGADLHAVARSRHQVEGRARRDAGVLHRVLQRLSGGEGSSADRAGQRTHAGHERAPAFMRARLLAVGAVLDVLLAAHPRWASPWWARWWASISARPPGSAT